MIVVDATVWRFGSEQDQNNMFKLIIVNGGSGGYGFANYNVYEGDPAVPHKGGVPDAWKLIGHIKGHDRSSPGERLVARALRMYEDR